MFYFLSLAMDKSIGNHYWICIGYYNVPKCTFGDYAAVLYGIYGMRLWFMVQLVMYSVVVASTHKGTDAKGKETGEKAVYVEEVHGKRAYYNEAYEQAVYDKNEKEFMVEQKETMEKDMIYR
eukprot:290346_1